VVTFVTGVEVLTTSGLPPAGYLVAVLAIMETPAIIVGLLLARGGMNGADRHNRRTLARDAAQRLGRAAARQLPHRPRCGQRRISNPSRPSSRRPFAACCACSCSTWGWSPRAAHGIALDHASGSPARRGLRLVNGTVGVLVGAAIGLDTGTAAGLGILAASASYIAVPAAMRMALPEADAGLYLSMSLGVTFPFNIVAGIPLYTLLAQWIVSP
jgi:uncharacterized protein